MKFSKRDYLKLDRIESTLREMASHYQYPELREVAVAHMKLMREAQIEQEPAPTWSGGGNDAA